MNDWADVYEEHVGHVYKFLMYFLGNREDAEDLTQETFIKAFHGWNKFDRRSSVRTWLVAISRNLALDRLRKKQRTQLLQRLLSHQPVTPVELPQEVLSLDESKRELYDAIQTLRPDYRAAVILKGIQEHSNTETALILGWSESKVRVTFHRAVKSLGLTMAKEELGYEEYSG
ncbi:MAG: RNA polymerase sigma factor [Tumebacillaceae bacterium]